jgi:hypothetical protein
MYGVIVLSLHAVGRKLNVLVELYVDGLRELLASLYQERYSVVAGGYEKVAWPRGAVEEDNISDWLVSGSCRS